MIIRALWGSVLALFVFTFSAQAQMFQQQFKTPVLQTTSVTSPAYVNSTSPSDTQFTFLGSSGTGLTVKVPGSPDPSANSLILERTSSSTSVTGGFTRALPINPSTTIWYIQFDFEALTTGGAATNAVRFMVGNSFTNNSTDETMTTRVAGKFGFSLGNTPGQFSLTTSTGTAIGPVFTGKQRITMVINRSATINYYTRYGTAKSLATLRYDVYVGDNRVITNATANNVVLNHFKLTYTGGTGQVSISNLLLDRFPPTPAVSPASNIAIDSFTAKWNSVSGAAGYRIDVSEVSNFATFVLENVYVSNNDSLNVTGLNPGTNYFYRVRAVNVFPVDSITGQNSSIQSVTTSPWLPRMAATPTVSNVGSDRATLGGTIISNSGAGIMQRGVVISKKVDNDNPLIGGDSVITVNFAGNTVGAFSQVVTMLDSATEYSFKAFATNAYGTSYSDVEHFTTTSTEPGAYPALSFDQLSTTGFRINWKWTSAQPAPAGYIVFTRTTPGNFNTTAPQDGVTYTVNQIVGDAKVLYIGNDSALVMSGLDPATAYGFTVYPFNGFDSTINYRTATSGISRQVRWTLSPSPTANAASVTVSDYNQSNVVLTIPAASTIPNAKGYVVLRRNGNQAGTTMPVDGTWYPAGATLGNAVVASVVTSSTATSVNITGLSANTTYTFSLIPYDTISNTQTVNYYTAGSEPSVTQTTLIAEPTTSPAITFTNIGPDSMRVNFAAATGATGYILLRTIETGNVFPNTNPTDRIVHNVGDTLGNAIIIYKKTLNTAASRTFAVMGLTPAKEYAYAVYPFAENATGINYRVASPSRRSQFTTVTNKPANHTTKFIADSIKFFSVRLRFDSAGSISNAKGYIILRREATASTNQPTDGVAYNVGGAIGPTTVAAIINSTSDTSVTITGLTDNVTHYFRIFPFNRDTASAQTSAYLTSGTIPEVAPTTPPSPPGANPTNLLFDQLTGVSMRLRWTAPTAFPSNNMGYIVLRTTIPGNSIPNTAPVNGTVYSVGSTLGNATIAYVGTAVQTTVTGLQPVSEYGFSIYAYRHTGTSIRYHLINPPLTGQKSTVSPPPTVPTTFMPFDHTTNSLKITWRNTSPAPDGYMLLRTTAANSTSYPTTMPINGNVYKTTAPDSILGNATIKYIGTDTTFTDTAVNPGSRYNYTVISFNGSMVDSSTNYLTTGAPQAFYYTLALRPTSHSNTLSVVNRSDVSITLSFDPATSGTNRAGYLVLVQQGTAPITDIPANANSYNVGATIGSSTVGAIVLGAANSVTVPNLVAETDYRFALIPFNRGGTAALTYNYNTDATIPSVTGLTLAPAAEPPSNLQFTHTTNSISLSWTAPSTPPTGYMVIRTNLPGEDFPDQLPENGMAYTQGQAIGTNATIVQMGTSTTYVDNGLIPGSRYNYVVLSYNVGTLSNTMHYQNAGALFGMYYTLSLQPAGHATSFTVSDITPVSLQLNYTAASTITNAAGYIILMKQGTTAPTDLPVNATKYEPMNTIGTSTVIAIVDANSTNTFVPDLQPDTDYRFMLIPFNSNMDAEALTHNYNLNATIPVVAAKTNDLMPVDFISYGASRIDDKVVIKWTVANQVNLAGYEVERSSNGTNFTSVAKVAPSNELNYSSIDANPLQGTSYYRIKAIDISGEVKYTGLMIVRAGKAQDIVVYPNPVTERKLNVNLVNYRAGKYNVSMVNAAGMMILSRTVVLTNNGSENVSIQLPGNVQPGAYYLQVTGDGVKTSKTIMVK